MISGSGTRHQNAITAARMPSAIISGGGFSRDPILMAVPITMPAAAAAIPCISAPMRGVWP